MFRLKVLFAICALLLLASTSGAQTTAATAAGLAGNWEVPLPVHGAASIYEMKVDVKGDTFTGNISIWKIADGKINGNDISFTFLQKDGKPLALYTGKFYGDQISLLSQDAPGSRHMSPESKHSWTAYRNPGKEPLEWVPDDVPPLPFVTPVAQKGESASGLPGRWEAPFVWGSKTYTYEFVFNPSEGGFTGNAGLLGSKEAFQIGEGKINGDNISFAWLQGGHPVARFTGTLYGQQLALVMEEVGAKPLPEAIGGKTHAMTAFRNDGDEPWYTWFPSLVDRGKMGSYSTLARIVHDTYKNGEGNMKLAATLAQVLNNVWDHGENDLLKRSPEVWSKIDHSMDLFILPIIRYHGGMPDPADVEQKYQSYITNLKLAN